MNLVWHIVKKDFTRMRLPLLLWTCLLLGQMILCERLFWDSSLEAAWFNRQGALIGLAVFLYAGIGYILVAMLVLEDTLVGAEMFWATRPIAGGRLLAAKLLGAALFFVVWPVLVGLPWWLWSGLGAADLLHAVRLTVIMQIVTIVPALMLAVLAGQSARFLLYSLVVIVAVPVGTGLVGYYLPKDLPRDIIASKALLAYGAGVLTAVAVIWLQFRSRRLVRSIVMTVAGAAVALLVGLFWPWDVLRFWPQDTTQMPGTEAISISFDQAKILHTKDGKAWVQLQFAPRDVPEEFLVFTGSIKVDFRWPDGTTLQRRKGMWSANRKYSVRRLLNLPPAQTDPATEEKKSQLQEAIRHRQEARNQLLLEQGGSPTPRSEENSNLLTTVIDVPLELVDKFTATPPACSIALHVNVTRPVLLMELPLKEGIRRTANGLRLHLARVEATEPPTPDQPVTQRIVTLIHSQPMNLNSTQFYLVDRAHGTEVHLGYGGGNGLVPLPTIPMRFHRTTFPVKIPQLWRNDQWIRMPEWLDAATLAAVALRSDGAFDRTLQIDRLEVVKK